MAVRRVSATLARTQELPYTTFLNSTIELIKNPDALAVYTYLQTKAEHWIVRREDVMKRFSIGKHRYTEAMSHLRQLGLVERVVTRDSSGKVTDNQLIIHYEPNDLPSGLRMSGNPDELDSGESGHLETDQSFKNESIDSNNSSGTSADAPCSVCGGTLFVGAGIECHRCSGTGKEPNTDQPSKPEQATQDAAEKSKPDGSAATDKKLNSYPEEFEWIWKNKPERSGSNGKKSAYNACRARIKDGATWRELAEGLKRYAAHCKADGKLNTPYVMQMATFFGPDEHFRNEWAANRPNMSYTGNQQPAQNQRREIHVARQASELSEDQMAELKAQREALKNMTKDL